ncbi:MAG: hypothetical protein KAT00_06635 [Planctomycetes bacterium]|nr:hypothetical protein [Planctomycetota bacterium]
MKYTNYIAKHWRGELSLAVSFWVNFGLLNIVISLIVEPPDTLKLIEHPVLFARMNIICNVIHILIVHPWQVFGLWRACNRHVRINGKRLWARTVQGLVTIGLIATLASIISDWPAYKDSTRLGFGKDKYGDYTLTLEKDNTIIHLQGGIGYGISRGVGKLLREFPEIEAIILDSAGGIHYEGMALARLVCDHSLDTYSFKGCSSAATTAFVMGKNRALGLGAELSFHSAGPMYETLSSIEYLKSCDTECRLVFEEQGVPSEFLDRIDATPNEELWYPTVDELLDAGVVNDIVNASDILPGEYGSISYQLKKFFADYGSYEYIQHCEPNVFTQMFDDLYEQAKGSATLIELRRAIEHQTESVISDAGQRTSDDAVIEHFKAEFNIVRKLEEIQPILAVQWLHPARYGNCDYSRHVSEDDLCRFDDAADRVIIDAYTKNNPALDTDAAKTLMEKIKDEHGEFEYMGSKNLETEADYERHCDAAIRFHELILAKDKAAAANLLRYIHSRD